jgi:phosphate transport system substrate-binding protein
VGRLTWLFVFLLAGSLLVLGVACGDDDDDDDDGETTATEDATDEPTSEATDEPTSEATSGGGTIDYGSLSGGISIDGSSTVFPITEAVAEEFAGVASDVQVTVGSSGTGAGFEAFCRGDIQISDASRPIEEDETQLCADAGIDDIVEIQVGIDALTVVAHADNDWAVCMTVDQLYQTFSEGGASTWADVDPSWPADPIVFYYPGTDSGTFDFFVEAVIAEVGGETGAHRGDGTASEDDNVLALGVEGDTNAIGYFGFAYYQGAGDLLRAVEVDGGDGCVAPSVESALAGDYYLSRPLFIYTRESFLADNPEVLGFVNFYLENAETLVQEVGYVNLPEDILAEQFAKLAPFLP